MLRFFFTYFTITEADRILFVYTEDFVIYRFVIYRSSTRHKMKYDRQICIRALLPYTNYQISVLNLLWSYAQTKKKKLKVFPIGRRQKQMFLSQINLFVTIQDGPPNIDILVSYIFDVFNTPRHQKVTYI